ncbi:unnamed protein product [Discosporangium mesarthrocarpum]
MRCLSWDVASSEGSHKSDDIADKHESMLATHGIVDPGQVAAIVTGGADTMNAAGRDYFNFTWHPCFDHRLQLMQGVLGKKTSDMSKALEKAKVLVRHFKLSTQASNLLVQSQ